MLLLFGYCYYIYSHNNCCINMVSNELYVGRYAVALFLCITNSYLIVVSRLRLRVVMSSISFVVKPRWVALTAKV